MTTRCNQGPLKYEGFSLAFVAIKGQFSLVGFNTINSIKPTEPPTIASSQSFYKPQLNTFITTLYTLSRKSPHSNIALIDIFQLQAGLRRPHMCNFLLIRTECKVCKELIKSHTERVGEACDLEKAIPGICPQTGDPWPARIDLTSTCKRCEQKK